MPFEFVACFSTFHFYLNLGSARLYREPVSKTNRPIILNAVEYVVLPGGVIIIKFYYFFLINFDSYL